MMLPMTYSYLIRSDVMRRFDLALKTLDNNMYPDILDVFFSC